jgi:hypothetical protein
MKRALIAACCVLGVALYLPSTGASAITSWLSYTKNHSEINGHIVLLCPYTGCIGPSFRGGSGNGNRDGCQTNAWIHNGRHDIDLNWPYGINGHADHFDGGPNGIHGRVWAIKNYDCDGNRTKYPLRTGLFIHSEETPSQGQTCGGSTAYIENQCWDGVNDYYSYGCIKIARRPVVSGYYDLRRADEWHHAYSIRYVNVYG